VKEKYRSRNDDAVSQKIIYLLWIREFR
jgi:hypothetical protein